MHTDLFDFELPSERIDLRSESTPGPTCGRMVERRALRAPYGHGALTLSKINFLLVAVLALSAFAIAPARGEDAAWTVVLKPGDFVIGPALSQLKTRHHWADQFDAAGNFEFAVRRAAVAIPSPQCRMDYLIAKIPFYYPENPKQAALGERRSVYNSLVALQGDGKGSVSIRVEAPLGLARTVGRRTELTSCSLFVALPLSMEFSKN
jgi:hypothetical protein